MKKNVLQRIPVSMIKENDLNDRSMEGPSILALANNIQQAGELLAPITVYKKGDDYVVVSGHRRLAAVKLLGWDDVPCFISEAPKDEFEEREILLSGNFHRSKPEEIRNELVKASQNWQSMPKEEREARKQAIKESFIERNKDSAKFKENPAEFIKHNLLYKEEYIRIKTGLDYSNMTISRLLKEVTNENGDDADPAVDTKSADEEEPEKKAPSKKVSGKKIKNSLDKLIEMIDKYESDDAAVTILMDDVRNDLIKARSTLSTLEEEY